MTLRDGLLLLLAAAGLVGCRSTDTLIAPGRQLEDDLRDHVCATCPETFAFPDEAACRAWADASRSTTAELDCLAALSEAHAAELRPHFECANAALADYDACTRAATATCPSAPPDVAACTRDLAGALAACPVLRRDLVDAAESCGPHQVFADGQWQIDCDGGGTCTPLPPRSVLGFDVYDGTFVCSVVETEGARTLSFYAASSADGMPFSAQLSGARVPRSGGSAAGSCVFAVGEGEGLFRGECGADAPSTAQPCQVVVGFGFDTMLGSTTVDIDVLCDHLPSATSPGELRSVHFPTTPGMPAAFRFYDCVGLSRE